jgi:hypothetical protein
MASGKAAGAALDGHGQEQEQAMPELFDVLGRVFTASASNSARVRTVFGWIYDELSAEQISRESGAYSNDNGSVNGGDTKAFFHLERSVQSAPISKVLQQVSREGGVEKAALALGEQLLGGDIVIKDLTLASSGNGATGLFANNHSLFAEAEAETQGVNLVLVRLPRNLRVADSLVGGMFDNIRDQCEDRCIMFATSQKQKTLLRDEVFDAQALDTYGGAVASMRQLLSMVGAPSPAPSSNSTKSDPVHMTPDVLSGILVSFFFGFIVLLTLSCMMNVNSAPKLLSATPGRGAPDVDPNSATGARYYPYKNLPMREY